MPLIECKSGPTTATIAGNEYQFSRDQYGRFVSAVEDARHVACFVAVEAHYQTVPDVPPPAPLNGVIAPADSDDDDFDDDDDSERQPPAQPKAGKPKAGKPKAGEAAETQA